MRNLIEKAINLAGSQGKLAAAAGVRQQSIWQAKEAGRASAELAIAIHRATAGAVSASELRPDLFPPGYEPPPLAAVEAAE